MNYHESLVNTEFTGLQKMRDHVDMSENLKKCEHILRKAGLAMLTPVQCGFP